MAILAPIDARIPPFMAYTYAYIWCSMIAPIDGSDPPEPPPTPGTFDSRIQSIRAKSTRGWRLGCATFYQVQLHSATATATEPWPWMGALAMNGMAPWPWMECAMAMNDGMRHGHEWNRAMAISGAIHGGHTWGPC